MFHDTGVGMWIMLYMDAVRFDGRWGGGGQASPCTSQSTVSRLAAAFRIWLGFGLGLELGLDISI